MAARKRASSRTSRSGLVGRAVTAGRKALRQAERRVPPDLRRQIERTVKDGQKTVISAIDELETRVRRSAKQADVDRVLKRLDKLAKQVQELARAASSRAAAGATSGRRRATSTARRATSPAKRKATTAKRSAPARKAAAAGPTAPRRAAAKPAAMRSAPRRSSRRASSGSAEVHSVPEPPAPGPVPESVDRGEGSA